jgi:hypothetical protein
MSGSSSSGSMSGGSMGATSSSRVRVRKDSGY